MFALLASAGCKDPPLAVLLLLRKHTEALAQEGCKDLLLALLLLLRQHRGGLLATGGQLLTRSNSWRSC